MKSRDARNLPVEALNERRRLAVRLRLAGMKVADVAVQAELSVPTVIAACKAYRAGGWDEVLVKPRGRSVGDKRALVPAQEAAICSLICSRLPAELDIGFGLWQRDAVQALVEVRA
ncbi:MAG TPA: IS630 family transposase, partial [Rhodocyclaceae bacterium]|nr:IS630 family transposase [Rhodocyclaceae bacterium]